MRNNKKAVLLYSTTSLHLGEGYKEHHNVNLLLVLNKLLVMQCVLCFFIKFAIVITTIERQLAA